MTMLLLLLLPPPPLPATTTPALRPLPRQRQPRLQ